MYREHDRDQSSRASGGEVMDAGETFEIRVPRFDNWGGYRHGRLSCGASSQERALKCTERGSSARMNGIVHSLELCSKRFG